MMPAMEHYSFCESISATSISPWCIRRLTAVGRKLGGGVDTPSLCGRVQVRRGWDLQVPVDPKLGKACPRCVEALAREGDDEAAPPHARAPREAPRPRARTARQKPVRCTHEQVTRYAPITNAEGQRCVSCGELVPWGQANDDERARWELLAADLASRAPAHGTDVMRAGHDLFLEYGIRPWLKCDVDLARGWMGADVHPDPYGAYDAGVLARAIAESGQKG